MSTHRLSFWHFVGFWWGYVVFFIHPSTAQTSLPYAPNGGVFTPKGHLHALVVLITFQDAPKSNPRFTNAAEYVEGWDMPQRGALPEGADANKCVLPKYFFAKEQDFETQFDQVSYNFSKEWYWVSGGQFRFTAELFADSTGKAIAVEIDPSGTRGWSQTNLLAFEKMQRLNPRLDLSRFDCRANRPNYRFDNTDTVRNKPDKNVDYIIFLYRYNTAWKEQPVLGMHTWQGAGGGVSAVAGIANESYNGYKCPDGFMMIYNSGVFLHEIAHSLYNAPHLMGGNNTVGDYWYAPTGGWGFTGGSIAFMGGMNGWERWYLGFTELTADIHTPANQSFVLRDFMTTGDVARIRLPFTSDQYCWLEYHRAVHPLDHHPWRGKVINEDTLPDIAAGVYAYVERIADSRNELFSALSDKCNGLRLLNAAGNWDYALLDTPAVQKNAWGNTLYAFRRMRPNPFSGTNAWYAHRADFNKDGKIDFNTNTNAAKQESQFIASEAMPDGSQRRLYHCFGGYDARQDGGYLRSPAFQPDDVLSCLSNPPLTNYPKYNAERQTFEPIRLHDLHIRFASAPQNNPSTISVQASRKPLVVTDETLFAASQLVLPDMYTSLDTPELRIQGHLILDRPATANRHTPDAKGLFTQPTHWVIESGAVLEIAPKGKWTVRGESTVSIQKGATIILRKKSKWLIESGRVEAAEGAVIHIHKCATVKVNPTAVKMGF